MAASSCCASRTPTRSDRRRRWSRGSSTGCAGSASSGTRVRRSTGRTRPISSRSASIGIAPLPGASSPRGTRTAATARPSSCRNDGRRRKPRAAPGHTIAPACRSIRPHAPPTSGIVVRARSGSVCLPVLRASTIWCADRSSSTTRTSRTSSSCAPTATRRTTCRSSAMTSTCRSRTWCAATITSRTRRSTCSCTTRSGRRCRSSRTCR